MHNHPNPNDLDGALMLLAAFVLICLAGALWIENKLYERRQRKFREIEEDASRAVEQAGAEAYVHHDRRN